MRRWSIGIAVLLVQAVAIAQYPITRTFELRIGQQRPRVTAVVEGPRGLLWCATDMGVLRTDGIRHQLILRTAPHAVISLAADRLHVYAATDDGSVYRCTGALVDTLLRDTTLAATPIRSMAIATDGSLWLGTYGDGLRVLREGRSERIGAANVLSDAHVNALCALPQGTVAVGTDQGIDVLDLRGRRLRTTNADNGAPDNLVLSLAFGHGVLYAGTDRAGVFSVDPLTGQPAYDPGQQRPMAAVLALALDDRSTWSGTDGSGMWLRSLDHGTYPPPAEIAMQRVLSAARATDGTLWWCDGSDRLMRADPDVLLVPRHENVDLRSISAIDITPQGRIVIATGNVVRTHSTAFTDAEHLWSVTLPLSTQAQIACVHADRWGRIWVGTMGQGIFRVDPDGGVEQFTEREGAVNDNVLSIRSKGDVVWFATLSGIGIWAAADPSGSSGSFERITTPGYGFVYDVWPVSAEEAYAATDGNGVLRVRRGGAAVGMKGGGPRDTYYSLCQDSAGGIWAIGPNTGFCHVEGDALRCMAGTAPAFEGEVFGVVVTRGKLLMIGAAGMAATPLAVASVADPGDAFGLHGVTAPLNCMRTDPSGAIWVACDRGLVRLRPREHLLTGALTAIITDLHSGDRPLLLSDALDLGHDQDQLSFGFTAPYPGSPEQIGFQFQLEGHDRDLRETQDREVDYASLQPGDYLFRVRAIMPGSTTAGPWSVLRFSIAAPFWRTPLAMLGFTLAAIAVFLLVLRARDQRIRFRERMEREKVRFQLEAVRSQVNPHFLFNSFNTLIDLIEEDRAKAIVHAQLLSDFFRNILQVRDKDLIPLGEDLVLLENYYALERRRFGDRISISIDVDDDGAHLLLPPLTLQLLLENALKHNAATLDDPLLVKVRAENGWLVVSNPHRPRSSSSRSTGFGLESLRKRFEALTDRHMEAGPQGGDFVVRIPLLPPEQ